jgi:hypothetical protein
MSTDQTPAIGTILWHDLTVPDAANVRDFYASVVGWQPRPVEMGDYDDYSMIAPDSGQGVAGVCHARGENAGLPPQWLVYVAVADIEASRQRCVEAGGALLTDVRGPEEGPRFCVIQDPAGAVMAIMQMG